MFTIICIATLLLAALVLQVRPVASKTYSLADRFPIYKIEDDCLLSKQGDITVVFEVLLPEVFTLAADELETVHHNWIRAIRILPPGTILHKQDWYTKGNFRSKENTEDEITFLNQASERFFYQRPIRQHACYLMVTRRADGRKPASSVFNNLLRPSLVQPAAKGQAFADFEDKVGQFEKLLSEGSFIQLRRLAADELAGTTEKPGLLEKYCFLLDAESEPLQRDISYKPEFRIGEKLCQLYSMSQLEDLPSLVGSKLAYDKYSTDRTKFFVSFAAPVGQLLDCDHIYNQYIVIEDTHKTYKKLEAKRRRLHSLSAYSRENAIARDAVNAYLNEAISESRQPVRAHFNLLVWTDDRDKLKDIRNMASSALAQMDANPREEIRGAAQLHWAAMPGNEGELPFNETFDTFCEQASCFLAQETSYRDSVSSFGLRLVDRQMGCPVWTDISDWPMGRYTSNRNKVILGSSGAGKSLAVNHLVRSYVEQGAHVVIVDVGHSYQGLTGLLGGYYFTHKESDPIRFNPFYLSPGDSMDTEKKESLKTLLVALWKREDEQFRRSEYVALSNALHMYFGKLEKNKAIIPCFNTFYDFLRDEYGAVLAGDKVKEKEFDIDNFLYVLRPYYKDGEFGYLLNATQNLDLLHQRLTVYEIDALKEHGTLFAVTTLVIMESFISKMRKLKGVRKVIIIEEAWSAIAKAGMASFIKYLYKTVRKHFGEAIVVTQEVDDLISSPVVKEAILNNADCKIILDIRKFANKFDKIQETLGLTDKGKTMVLSLNRANDPRRKYREIYIELGGQYSRVFGYEPSPEEYYCYTTEEKEKVLVQQYADRFGGDIRKGIRALIEDLRIKQDGFA
ncbi:TraG family conjugative transposon ATPase [Chitinophaga barathri]|uniref:TraG family conjugative transposon ATPase n=1 Tax=Chitinophaga barathri TaxID=1647451 RepID=A0A3N4MM66_9BACT|nr:TraG family conjugative transposon ATPase [Chitinophaga barathri]RPD43097.1 TraG family conjugative transposon ATPase [Chitinophaga barathri]